MSVWTQLATESELKVNLHTVFPGLKVALLVSSCFLSATYRPSSFVGGVNYLVHMNFRQR